MVNPLEVIGSGGGSSSDSGSSDGGSDDSSSDRRRRRDRIENPLADIVGGIDDSGSSGGSGGGGGNSGGESSSSGSGGSTSEPVEQVLGESDEQTQAQRAMEQAQSDGATESQAEKVREAVQRRTDGSTSGSGGGTTTDSESNSDSSSQPSDPPDPGPDPDPTPSGGQTQSESSGSSDSGSGGASSGSDASQTSDPTQQTSGGPPAPGQSSQSPADLGGSSGSSGAAGSSGGNASTGTTDGQTGGSSGGDPVDQVLGGSGSGGGATPGQSSEAPATTGPTSGSGGDGTTDPDSTTDPGSSSDGSGTGDTSQGDVEPGSDPGETDETATNTRGETVDPVPDRLEDRVAESGGGDTGGAPTDSPPGGSESSGDGASSTDASDVSGEGPGADPSEADNQLGLAVQGSGFIREQAQDLKDRALEQTGLESRGAFKIVRDGDMLRAELTQLGERRLDQQIADRIERRLETTQAERAADQALEGGATEEQAADVREAVEKRTDAEPTIQVDLEGENVDTRMQPTGDRTGRGKETDPDLSNVPEDQREEIRETIRQEQGREGRQELTVTRTLDESGRRKVREAQIERIAERLNRDSPVELDEDDFAPKEGGGITLSQEGREKFQQLNERRREGLANAKEAIVQSATGRSPTSGLELAALQRDASIRGRTAEIRARQLEDQKRTDSITRKDIEDSVGEFQVRDDRRSNNLGVPDELPSGDIEDVRRRRTLGQVTAPRGFETARGDRVTRATGPTPNATPEGDLSEFARNVAAAALDFSSDDPRLTIGPFNLTEEEIKRRTGGINTPAPNVNLSALFQSVERGIDIATFQRNPQTVEGPILEPGKSDEPNAEIVDSLTRGRGLFATGRRSLDRPDQLLNRPDIENSDELSNEEIAQRYAQATPGVETGDVNVTRTDRGVQVGADLDAQDLRERVAAVNEGVASDDVIVRKDGRGGLKFSTATDEDAGFMNETEQSIVETIRGRRRGFGLADQVPDAVPDGPAGSFVRGVADFPGELMAFPASALFAADKLAEGTANFPRTAGEYGLGRTIGTVGLVAAETLETTTERAAENPGRFLGQLVAELAFSFGASRAIRAAPGRAADIRARVTGKPILDLDDRITSARVASGDADVPTFDTAPTARVSEAVAEVRSRAADQPAKLQNIDRFGVAEAAAFRAGRAARGVTRGVRDATPDVGPSPGTVFDRVPRSRPTLPDRTVPETAGRATGRVTGRLPDSPVDRPSRPGTPDVEFGRSEDAARRAGERVADARDRVSQAREGATERVERAEGRLVDRFAGTGGLIRGETLEVISSSGDQVPLRTLRLQSPFADGRDAGVTVLGFRGARPFVGSPAVDLDETFFPALGRAGDRPQSFAPATGAETDIIRKSLQDRAQQRRLEAALDLARIGGRGTIPGRELSARRAISRVDELPDEATDDVLAALEDLDASIKGSAAAIEQAGGFRAPGDLDIVVDDPIRARRRLQIALEGTDVTVDEAFDLVTEDFISTSEGRITLGQAERSELRTEEGIRINPIEEELIRKVQGGAANVRRRGFADEPGRADIVDVGAKPKADHTRLKDFPDAQVLAREIVNQRSRETNPLDIVGQVRRARERRTVRRFEDRFGVDIDAAPDSAEIPGLEPGPVGRVTARARDLPQQVVSAAGDTRVAGAARRVGAAAGTAQAVAERPLQAGERAGLAAGRRVNQFIEAAEGQRPDGASLPDSLLLRSEAKPLTGELNVGRGQYELPGLFVSPDLSLLRLSRERASSLIPNVRLGIPFARSSDDQVTVFPGDDIRGMPDRAAGSGRIFPEDGDPFPDPDAPGARYLEEEAEPGVAYIRASGDRTRELEAVFPPDTLFREIERFRLRIGDRTVEGRAFERVDPENVADDAADAADAGDVATGRRTSTLDEGDVDDAEKTGTGDRQGDERVSRDELVTAEDLPETRVTRRADEADPVSPVPGTSGGDAADRRSGETLTSVEDSTADSAAATGTRGPDSVVDTAATMERLFRAERSQPAATGQASRKAAAELDEFTVSAVNRTPRDTPERSGVTTPSEVEEVSRPPSEAEVSEATYDPSVPGRGTPSLSTSTPTRTPTESTPTTSGSSTPGIPITSMPTDTPQRGRPFGFDDEDDEAFFEAAGSAAKQFGSEVATSESVLNEDIQSYDDIEFTEPFEETIDEGSLDAVNVEGNPTDEDLMELDDELEDLDL